MISTDVKLFKNVINVREMSKQMKKIGPGDYNQHLPQSKLDWGKLLLVISWAEAAVGAAGGCKSAPRRGRDTRIFANSLVKYQSRRNDSTLK